MRQYNMSTINAPLRDVIAAAKRLELEDIDVCPMGDPWSEITGSLFSKRLTAVSPNEFTTQFLGDFNSSFYAPYIPCIKQPEHNTQWVMDVESVDDAMLRIKAGKHDAQFTGDLRGHGLDQCGRVFSIRVTEDRPAIDRAVNRIKRMLEDGVGNLNVLTRRGWKILDSTPSTGMEFVKPRHPKSDDLWNNVLPISEQN